MKLRFLLLLPLLIGARPSAPPAVRVILSPLTRAAYLTAKKRLVKTSPRLIFPIKKHGRIILIHTAAGPRVFRDATVAEDNPSWEKYTYLGYSAQGAYHLILRNHYEWSSYILLQQNGRRIEVPNEPIFSPDTSAFVVASASLDYETMPNSLQIFRFGKQGWRQISKLEPREWEPTQINWVSATTMLLKQKHWDSHLERPWYIYAKLTIR